MAANVEWHCEKRASSDNENVTETGCLSIIVLGASGDLAKKKTFPALFNLYQQVFYISFLIYDQLSVVCCFLGRKYNVFLSHS